MSSAPSGLWYHQWFDTKVMARWIKEWWGKTHCNGLVMDEFWILGIDSVTVWRWQAMLAVYGFMCNTELHFIFCSDIHSWEKLQLQRTRWQMRAWVLFSSLPSGFTTRAKAKAYGAGWWWCSIWIVNAFPSLLLIWHHVNVWVPYFMDDWQVNLWSSKL